MVKHDEEAPFLSFTSLAREVRVSDAMVPWFYMARGYSGYVDFQKDLQRWIQSKFIPSKRL